MKMRMVCVAIGAALLCLGCDSDHDHGSEHGNENGEHSSPGGESEPRSKLSEAGLFQVTYAPEPDPIPVGTEFAMRVQIAAVGESVALKSVKVDAEMPDHKHGMSVAPVTTADGGDWQVEPMLFQMPGRWVLHIDIETEGGATDKASFEIQCVAAGCQ